MLSEVIYRAEEVIRSLPARPDFKLVLMENHETGITLRDGEVEKMLRATSLSLAINLYIDGRDGFFYTGDLRPESVREFIVSAYETTLLLEPDESRGLPDPDRYYKGDGSDLENFDPTLSELPPDEVLNLMRDIEAEAAGRDSRIIGMQTRYADRQHQAHYIISNGFEGREQSSHCTLTCIATADGEGGQHPMDGWGETRIFFRQMPRTGVAATALARTLRKIGQRPAPSGRYRMILESPCAGSFVQPLLNAMGGQALQQRASFLMDRLGQQVLSPLVNIVDDPLQPGTRGASHFDYDGVATRRRELFTEGRLQTYFIDTPMSRKLSLPPTTQGIHRLIMQQGEQTLEDIIAGSERAILVTDFNGGNCDPVMGNFSYGIEGLLIEHGIVTQPVSGMNVTGSMLDTWQHLSAIACDADPWETEVIPSLAFEDVYFGGC